MVFMAKGCQIGTRKKQLVYIISKVGLARSPAWCGCSADVVAVLPHLIN